MTELTELLEEISHCRICEPGLPLGARPVLQCSEGARVKDWRAYWPAMLPLPHPSPRNNRWLKSEILPELKARIDQLLR